MEHDSFIGKSTLIGPAGCATRVLGYGDGLQFLFQHIIEPARTLPFCVSCNLRAANSGQAKRRKNRSNGSVLTDGELFVGATERFKARSIAQCPQRFYVSTTAVPREKSTVRQIYGITLSAHDRRSRDNSTSGRFAFVTTICFAELK